MTSEIEEVKNYYNTNHEMGAYFKSRRYRV